MEASSTGRPGLGSFALPIHAAILKNQAAPCHLVQACPRRIWVVGTPHICALLRGHALRSPTAVCLTY